MKALLTLVAMAMLPALASADEQMRARSFEEVNAEANQPPRARADGRPEGWELENAKRQSAELARMQASDEALRAKARKECGEDFGMPRVGMTLQRARQCLGYARLVGQVNRKDGVASVYVNGRVQLIVMDGKVVAWQGLR